MKYYLVTVEGVEPCLHGPFKENQVNKKVRKINKGLDPEDSLIFLLKIDKKGNPDISSFSGLFFSNEEKR